MLRCAESAMEHVFTSRAIQNNRLGDQPRRTIFLKPMHA
ncbi:ribonuclease PH [Burkholderia pseudomallei 305]|nr:ribonuclease PH [Burkholderia pseudomallei 305]